MDGVAESINSIVLRWDGMGRILSLNPYGQEFFGYANEEVVGRSVMGILVPETETSGRDLARMIDDILHHPERYVSNENENIRRNGERAWITWRNRPILDETGRLREILSTGIDTTERRRAEEALRESEWRFRVLFQSTPVALLERDASALKAELDRLRAEGVGDVREYLRARPEELPRLLALVRTCDANAAALALFEAQSVADVGTHPSWIDPDDAASWHEIIAALADGTVQSREREQRIQTLGGRRRHVVVKATAVPGHEETFSRIILAVLDVTERKQAEEALRASEERFRHLSCHDDLTGLFNTRYLYEALRELIEASATAGTQFSVLFLDIDRFKHVVDTYGHLNGSRTIQEVAAVIRASLPEPAWAVAYAGDEFVVVLPGVAKSQAVEVAERIRARIAGAVYLEARGYAVRVTASFGVATYPEDARDLEGILALADRALFDVKRGGKNAVGAVGHGES